MSLGRATAALGVAGLAVAHLRRSKGTTKPTSERHRAVAQGFKLRMPCDVAPVGPEIHGFSEIKGFSTLWEIQRESLVAKFGAAGPDALGNVLFHTPQLTGKCALQWCQLWIAIAAEAKEGAFSAELGDHVDSNVVKDIVRESLVSKSRKRVAATAIALALSSPDEQTALLREVMRSTATLAANMDSAIHVKTGGGLPTTGDIIRESGRDAAQGIGDGIAWGIEGIAAPIIGGTAAATFGVMASALLPYLAAGGVIYYLAKRR